jgi:hypothetical protein
MPSENNQWVQSCRILCGKEHLSSDGAFDVFVEEFWKKLRAIHAIGVVKPEKEKTL